MLEPKTYTHGTMRDRKLVLWDGMKVRVRAGGWTKDGGEKELEAVEDDKKRCRTAAAI